MNAEPRVGARKIGTEIVESVLQTFKLWRGGRHRLSEGTASRKARKHVGQFRKRKGILVLKAK